MDRIADFQVFAQVAETGSFSAAARSLRMSASAVSKLIARMENRTKVRLFDRSTKAAILTREGEAFLESIRHVIDAMADAEAVADLLSRTPHGALRIHTSPSFARTLIGPLLPEFMSRYPDLRIEFRLGPKFVGLADDMDLAIQFGALADSSLVLSKIAMSRRVLCASPAYLERHGTPADPNELGAHQLLNYTMPGRESWPFVNGKTRYTVPIVARVYADQAEILLDLARNGMGIARVPEFDVADDFAAGRLVPLLTAFSEPEAIYVVVRTRRNLSPRLRVFIEFVQQKLNEASWNLDRR